MKKTDYTMLIMSCDAFSDLWDGYFALLSRNWPGRLAVKTILATDRPTDVHFSGIDILSIGADVPWTKRLQCALDEVQTEYILLTLDDYYINAPVSDSIIMSYFSYMDSEKIDYFRLYSEPKRATGSPVPGFKDVYHINTSFTYSVNLYTGLWRTEFLKNCIANSLDVWNFEVSLAETAQKLDARCLMSRDAVYPFLDVVRKGKLLRSAVRYFKAHPELYHGSREVNSWQYEARLRVQTSVSRHAPEPARQAIKAVMRKFGYHFYS